MKLYLADDSLPIGFDSGLSVSAALLAYDEVLLSWMDQSAPSFGVMRLWTAPSSFVVMGYGKQVNADVNRDACEADSVPILRRCSGGGTVLQALGCLSYSLILPISSQSELGTIQSTTSWVMAQQSMCLQDFLGASVSVKGTSDLTLGDLKISGNAQRRGRRSVLFHGTILCQVDISAISRYLKVPSYQPDYRANRGHADFVRSLGVDPLGLRQHMIQWWQPDSASTEIPYEQLKTDLTLLKETYLNPTFIYQR